MSFVRDPSSDAPACGCSRGRHSGEADHAAAAPAHGLASRRTLEETVLRTLFPESAERRRVLRAVGASAAASLLAQFFPFDALQALAAEKRPLEKKQLKVGFVPITCTTPIIMTHPPGFYAKHGLDVEVIKTAGRAS